jgi:hypothetical protein
VQPVKIVKVGNQNLRRIKVTPEILKMLEKAAQSASLQSKQMNAQMLATPGIAITPRPSSTPTPMMMSALDMAAHIRRRAPRGPVRMVSQPALKPSRPSSSPKPPPHSISPSPSLSVDPQLLADIEFPDADNVVINQVVPEVKVVSSGARAIGTFGNKSIKYPASEEDDDDDNIEPQPTDGGEEKDDEDEELGPLVDVVNTTPKRKRPTHDGDEEDQDHQEDQEEEVLVVEDDMKPPKKLKSPRPPSSDVEQLLAEVARQKGK